MNKRKIRSWKKTVLSLVLAFVLAFEPSIISMAANGQGAMEDVVTEEQSDEAESVTVETQEEIEETATEETISEAEENTTEETISEAEENTTEETVSEVEENTTEENVDGVETSTAEEIISEVEETITEVETDIVIYSTSTDSDFVIADGVLKSYTGTATEVIIPEGVTEIAADAFKNNKTIESVEFPDAMKMVGESAFASCSRLKEVKLNEGLTTIGNYAFAGVGFGGKTETQATVYGTLTIPGTVTSIGAYAFENTVYLQEVIFENGETESLDYPYSWGVHNMFAGSKSLKKVTLPDRATMIPYEAFKGCTALEEVYIGKNVQTIDKGAFQGCSSLETIECPAALTTIGAYAFAGCSELKEAKLNEGLTTISEYAFSEAGFGGKTETQATVYGTLIIPGTVISIGAYAFENTVYLQEVIFENGETESLDYPYSWGVHNMFAGSKNLKKVTLPDRATMIPYEAFKGCTALEEVYIGKNIQTIDKGAFQGCSSLETIECPAALTTIGAYAFAGCSGLKEAKLNEGLTTIGEYAFSEAGFGGKTETQATVYGTLTIPGTVISIGAYAFDNSAYLQEVIFENGETESLDYPYSWGVHNMFAGSKNLKKVTLPDRATMIPYEAFKGCTALEEVYIGKNVQTIEKGAFQGCSELREVNLNEGLTTIGEYAFSGVGFGGKTETQATVYGTLIIPGTVISIGAYAFDNSKYLQEVIFENGEMESIDYPYSWDVHNMFAGSKNLKKVTLPDRATMIPYEAFKGCTALEEVYLGKNVQTIDKGAFQGCSSLETIECPAALTTIGAYAFADCSGLKEAKLNEGLGIIKEYAFSEAAFGGANEIQKIEYGTLVIPSTVYSIGAYAFENCTYLEEVSFPNGIIEALELTSQYGSVATFQNCKNLKRVYLPERLTELPSNTFKNCTSLDTLFIPQSVVTIDDNAVRECNYRKLVIYGDPGSAAEAFADKLGIKFKNKSELGIYVKSIRLNRKSIIAAGEEAINSKVGLEATVLPVTAQNKAVLYTSNDEMVATVDRNGVVTIVGYGETDIVASSAENPEITVSCHVEILKKWTEEELNEIREYIETNNNFTVVSNVYTNLQNLMITAPDGIKAEWKVPYEVETGVNTYDVCLNKDGYLDMILKDVTVTGITVKDVTIDGASIIQIGKGYQASVEIVTEGGELAKDDYLIEWRSANNSNVKVTASDSNPLEASVSGNMISKNTNIYAKVVLVRDGKAVSIAKSDLGLTWFEPVLKITVSDYAVVDEITVSATQNERPIELDELAELVNIEGTVAYELKASASGYGENISDVAFTWKSSDEKVAKVKKEKDGKVILSVLGKGSSTITVIASKNGGFKTSFKVTVKDSTPRLVEKNVTINRYLTDASSSITLLPSDGYKIQNESLTVVDAKTGAATAFEVKPVDENGYAIGIKEGQNVSGGKYKVKILVKTSAEEVESHELPVSVKVVENVPKVSFRQSAINLFEKDGRGAVEIITDAKIEDITYTSNAGLGSVRLVQAETNPGEGIFYVKSENALAANYTKTANKGTLEIRFAGYKEEASYSKTIKLAVNKKLPSITATPESATLYPETLADTTEIVLYNKTAKESVLAENGYAVSVKELGNYKYTSNEGIDFPAIQALKGAKKGTLIYTVTNSKWLDGVKATAKCGLKIGKRPVLSFATGKITLNTAYTTGEYDAVTVDAYVKGFSDIVFKDAKTKTVGKDAKSQTVLNDGALAIYLKNGDIKAGITDSKYFTKAGNYTYIVTAYSEDNLPVQGTLKVAVVPSNKKASVSFKSKGSINLLDRKNTSVIVTPTIKNYTGTVKEVELYGVNAGKFKAEIQDGKIIITAQSGKALKANKAYQVGMYVTLDSDVTFTSQIKVTPKQKNPKLTQSTKTVVLFESAKGIVYGKDITIDVAAKQSGKIKNIELVSVSDTFGFELDEDGTGVIYVKETASLKAGKKYSIKLAVTFADDASNAKPSYITVKVDYRKF